MASGTINKYMDGTDSGWKYITGEAGDSKPFNGTIYYRTIGNIVTIQTSGTYLKTTLTGSYVLLANGFLSKVPKAILYAYCANTSKSCPVRVDTSGNLHLFKGANSSWTTEDAIAFTIVYLV